MTGIGKAPKPQNRWFLKILWTTFDDAAADGDDETADDNNDDDDDDDDDDEVAGWGEIPGQVRCLPLLTRAKARQKLHRILSPNEKLKTWHIDRLFLSGSQYLSSLQELNFSCPKQVRFFTSLVANLVYNKNSNLCTLPSCQISKLFINIGSQYLDIVERVHW